MIGRKTPPRRPGARRLAPAPSACRRSKDRHKPPAHGQGPFRGPMCHCWFRATDAGRGEGERSTPQSALQSRTANIRRAPPFRIVRLTGSLGDERDSAVSQCWAGSLVFAPAPTRAGPSRRNCRSITAAPRIAWTARPSSQKKHAPSPAAPPPRITLSAQEPHLGYWVWRGKSNHESSMGDP